MSSQKGKYCLRDEMSPCLTRQDLEAEGSTASYIYRLKYRISEFLSEPSTNHGSAGSDVRVARHRLLVGIGSLSFSKPTRRKKVPAEMSAYLVDVQQCLAETEYYSIFIGLG
jgi:hypothetical protein